MNGLPDPEGSMEVTVEAVRDLAGSVAAGEVRLIDCREPDEWHLNRLPDAHLQPLSSFADWSASIAVDPTPCIIYCHHGMRSLRATAALRSLGLREVWSMAGGIDSWSARIDPTVPRY